jgi:hypothetical protein
MTILLANKCSYCGAKPGEPCHAVDSLDTQLFPGQVHSHRWKEAISEDYQSLSADVRETPVFQAMDALNDALAATGSSLRFVYVPRLREPDEVRPATPKQTVAIMARENQRRSSHS